MRFLILLLLASCTSTGGAPVVARVETSGALSIAFDANSYVAISGASGYAQLRDTRGLPLYQIEFGPDTVLVGHLRDPEVSWRGAPGEPVPADFWPWVEAVLTPAEIDAMGLIQEPAGPTL